MGKLFLPTPCKVYRHLNIGTAKPSLTEREGVPHHLMDIVDPGENYNVVRFQSEVKQLIPAIVGRGHLPMLVGGTGLYISAVVDNYNFSHDGPNPLLRRQLTARAVKLGSQTLHRELSQVDPAAAEKIQRTDTRRLVRALEVSASGQQFSASKHGPPLYRVVQIGLTRKRTKLYEAVNQRVEQMFDRGLVEEANWILQLDLPPNLPVLQALGYKEIFPYLQGEVSIDEAKDNLKRQTRRFVKRQLTWFRRDERIIWLDRDEYSDQEALTAQIAEYSRRKTLGEPRIAN